MSDFDYESVIINGVKYVKAAALAHYVDALHALHPLEEALIAIQDTDPVDAALDPDRARRIACEALRATDAARR